MSKFLKKNYGWLIVTLIALGQLIIVIAQIDFSNGISYKESPDSRFDDGLAFLVHVTGEWAIRWMVAILLATPVTILTGLHSVLVRQALGIATAIFSMLHFAFFIVEEGFNETFEEINYIAGFLAIIILIPLLLTSNRKSMRLLKKTWKKIQRFSYAVIVLSLIHIAFLEDVWIAYALVVGLGFVMRMDSVKEKIIAKRIEVLSKYTAKA